MYEASQKGHPSGTIAGHKSEIHGITGSKSEYTFDLIPIEDTTKQNIVQYKS